MKWLPSEEDRDPRWVVTQIVFAVVITFLLSPVYLKEIEMDWRVPLLMIAMWGVFALVTLHRPQHMKDHEARVRAKWEARIQRDLAEKRTKELKGQQGDGI